MHLLTKASHAFLTTFLFKAILKHFWLSTHFYSLEGCEVVLYSGPLIWKFRSPRILIPFLHIELSSWAVHRRLNWDVASHCYGELGAPTNICIALWRNYLQFCLVASITWSFFLFFSFSRKSRIHPGKYIISIISIHFSTTKMVFYLIAAVKMNVDNSHTRNFHLNWNFLVKLMKC